MGCGVSTSAAERYPGLNPGRLEDDHILDLMTIGTGSYSKIKKCKLRSNGKTLVVKVMRLDADRNPQSSGAIISQGEGKDDGMGQIPVKSLGLSLLSPGLGR